jgi:adenosylcobinamide-GDP ribazoletransferase
MRLLAAFSFLTVLPWPGRAGVHPGDIGAGLAWFPLVGLFIGGILFGLNLGLSLVLPAAVTSALLLAVLVVLSGGLHLDGFMDTCDGIFCKKTARERWQVMSDSRVGAFGVVAAFLLLVTLYGGLSSLGTGDRGLALLLMPVLGRWAMVFSLFAFPAAKPEGLGRFFQSLATGRRLALATVIAVAAVGALLFLRGVVPLLSGLGLFLVVWGVAWALGRLFVRRFGGLTGDNYGAVNEISQVIVLLFVVLLPRWS